MSNYAGFDVKIDNENGTHTSVPSLSIDIYNAVTGAPLGTTASNSSGSVPPGSVAVAVGTRIRFTGDLGDGRVAYCEALTS